MISYLIGVDTTIIGTKLLINKFKKVLLEKNEIEKKLMLYIHSLMKIKVQ